MERIVCGIDGSDASLTALDWAVDEAVRNGATLRIVHAWFEPMVGGYPFAAGVMFESAAVEEAAEQVLAGAVRHAQERDPSLKVEGMHPHSAAATALIDESKHADLVVVGSRGHGGFTGLLLGSVSQQVVHHAQCPVVVVPTSERA